jgi:hypothetical protein
MSVEQVAVLTALASLLEKIGGWPLGLIVFVVIVGPWILSVFLAWIQQKRIDVVVEMYKNNVKLLEKDQELSCDLKDIVIMNTTAMTRLVDRINGMRAVSSEQ